MTEEIWIGSIFELLVSGLVVVTLVTVLILLWPLKILKSSHLALGRRHKNAKTYCFSLYTRLQGRGGGETQTNKHIDKRGQ